MSHPHTRLLDAVVHRASMDGAFRAQLLASPREAIQDAFGAQVPADYVIRFTEKPAGVDELVVLPDLKNGEEELSDDELENVAGGTDGDSAWAPPPPPPTGSTGP